MKIMVQNKKATGIAYRFKYHKLNQCNQEGSTVLVNLFLHSSALFHVLRKIGVYNWFC